MTERAVPVQGGSSKSGVRARRDWLDAILADPTGDAPRLAYADHLTARGDPRGEFIELQCALGRGVGTEEMAAREKALLELHGRQWLAGLEQLVDVEWRRGFPVKASVRALDFATTPALARVPLESVLLTHFQPRDSKALVAARPHPTVHAFRFGSGFADATCRLLSAPLFSRAVTLDFSSAELGSSALFDELAKTSFPKLRALVVSATGLDDAQLSRLSASKFWPRLDTLELAPAPALSAAMVTSLTSATGLRTLRLSKGFSPAAAPAQKGPARFALDERWGMSLLKHAPRSLRTLDVSVDALPPSLRASFEKRFRLEG